MENKFISSKKNEIIKETTSLLSSSSKNSNLFLVEGARLCEDAVRSGTSIFRLFYTEKSFQKYSKYINKIKEKTQEVYLISDAVASALSSTKTTQAVFAVCFKKENSVEIKGKILVLENLQDPSNLGAILRTGEAVGINTFVLVGECADVFLPKVTRASMGAIFRVNLIKYSKLSDLLSVLCKLNYKTYAAVPVENAKKITDVNFNENVAVFIGNEGNGLSDECIQKCENLTIPMKGIAESLNASVAASIIMWEMMRDV